MKLNGKRCRIGLGATRKIHGLPSSPLNKADGVAAVPPKIAKTLVIREGAVPPAPLGIVFQRAANERTI